MGVKNDLTGVTSMCLRREISMRTNFKGYLSTLTMRIPKRTFYLFAVLIFVLYLLLMTFCA